MSCRITLAIVFAALPLVAHSEEDGASLFATHCAACHGDAGQGEGRLTPKLSVAPPDLTDLSARNDGVFPTRQVIEKLVGRTAPPEHSGPMPFVAALQDGKSVAVLTPDGIEIQTRAPVVALTDYLETLQR